MSLKIHTIEATGFKGSSFNQTLGAVTLLSGGNFRGKTRRIQALVLALAGYVPEVAKKSNEVFGLLSSSNPMSVSAVGKGFFIKRTFTERRGSVSCTVEADGVDKTFAVPPVSVDATEFFALSEKERVKFIFSRITAGSDLGRLAAHLLSEVKAIKAAEGSDAEAVEAVVQDLVLEINNAFEDARRLELSVQDHVAALVADFGERKRKADADEKRLTATVEGMTQLAATASSARWDCERHLSEQRLKYDMANREVGSLNQTIRTLESQIAAARRLADSVVDEAGVLREIEQLTREREAAAAVTAPPEFDAADAVPDASQAERLAALSALKATLFTAVQQPQIDTTEDYNRQETSRRNLAEVFQRDRELKNEIQRLHRELETTSAETCCSKCKQSIEKLMERVLADLREKIQALESKMAFSSSIVAIAQANLDQSSEAVRIAEQAFQLHRENTDRFRQTDLAHRNLREEVVENHRRQWDKLNRAHSEAQRKIIVCDENIARGRAKLEDKSAATAAEQLPKLETQLMDARGSLAFASGRVNESSEEIGRLNAKQREITRQRSEEATRQNAVAEATKSKTEASVLKTVCELITAMQAALVEAAITPLVVTVNQICGGILPRQLEYKDGEIGWTLPSGFVTHRSMSGTEKALTFCALSIALASASPIKLLILDEIGRLDADNKLRLVQTLLDLVERGVLDQAVLADTNADAFMQLTPESGFKQIAVRKDLAAKGFEVVQL